MGMPRGLHARRSLREVETLIEGISAGHARDEEMMGVNESMVRLLVTI